ncbi:2-amino-4-hydroxy-6-hydroxymethyldihydropteridine diphosphokinase [Pajaroellobacter abortibovis]|nr:2-amino-4-hydroxy-6-hydroxymethyldihydropteridine diphosphokinase [Pajaroellobacter abortibovis]
MRRTVVGLGSNLGDRLGMLQAAVSALHACTPVLAVSKVYETQPIGPPQPLYLNAAVLFLWEGSPFELLTWLQTIESSLGRIRHERWGPRTIDMDILWIEGIAFDSTVLHIPHASLRERAFALIPFLELVPDAVDPENQAPFVCPPTGGVCSTLFSLEIPSVSSGSPIDDSLFVGSKK